MIHDAELFTVGPDEVVVTFRTDDAREVETRVGDRASSRPVRITRRGSSGLEPSTRYPVGVAGAEASPLLPAEVTTLARPSGPLLATIATVNDVHFGEIECGLLGTPEELGPFFAAEPGAEPYPEVMNRGAIDEIEQLDPDAVLVKGDLTDRGTEEEYAAFLARVRTPRRPHAPLSRQSRRDDHASRSRRRARSRSSSTGVTLAVLDTVRPGPIAGASRDEQLDWLDELAARATRRCSCSATITRGTRARRNATTRTSESIPTTASRCAR